MILYLSCTLHTHTHTFIYIIFSFPKCISRFIHLFYPEIFTIKIRVSTTRSVYLQKKKKNILKDNMRIYSKLFRWTRYAIVSRFPSILHRVSLSCISHRPNSRPRRVGLSAHRRAEESISDHRGPRPGRRPRLSSPRTDNFFSLLRTFVARAAPASAWKIRGTVDRYGFAWARVSRKPGAQARWKFHRTRGEREGKGGEGEGEVRWAQRPAYVIRLRS